MTGVGIGCDSGGGGSAAAGAGAGATGAATTGGGAGGAVTLTRAGDRLIASPPPNIAGLLEVRGVGLARLPVAPPAPVALILTLGGPPPPRLPEIPLPTREIAGLAVPVLAFDPAPLAPAARAAWALAMHGLAHQAASLCGAQAPDGT